MITKGLTDVATFPFNSNDVITNLSSFTPTTEEENVLIKGLNDGIPRLEYRKRTYFRQLN